MYRRVETSSSATLNTQTLTLKKGHSIIKASLIGGFFVAVQLLLSSCGREDHSDKMVFRYNEPSGIPTLDPAFARDKSTIWAVGQLYEGLFALNENNEVVPALRSITWWSILPIPFSYERRIFIRGGVLLLLMLRILLTAW